MSRPEELSPQSVEHVRVAAVLHIVDDEDKAVALQIVLVDGSSIVCTVWTDWSLVVERRSDAAIPEYLWPAEEHSRTSIVPGVPESGLEIVSLTVFTDEVGDPVRADIAMEGHLLTARSSGGELLLSVR